MMQEEKKAQKDEEIVDGEWGIHFSAKSLPEERFDPFHSYIDQKGTRIGHKTIFSPIRLQRPFEFRNITLSNYFVPVVSDIDTQEIESDVWNISWSCVDMNANDTNYFSVWISADSGWSF